MAKVVCIDSQIFIWGLKRESIESQKNKIPQCEKFLSDLDEKNIKILLPVPVITELLSHIADEAQKATILGLMNNTSIIVKPFDKIAAVKCSELLHRTFTDEEIRAYTKENRIPKAKIKYDAMITAIAIVNKCDCIYAEDSDLDKYSHGQIKVNKLPAIPIQHDLFTSNIVEEKK